jgi:hypothetical protein
MCSDVISGWFCPNLCHRHQGEYRYKVEPIFTLMPMAQIRAKPAGKINYTQLFIAVGKKIFFCQRNSGKTGGNQTKLGEFRQQNLHWRDVF